MSQSPRELLFIGVTEILLILPVSPKANLLCLYIRRGFGQRHELLVKANNIIQTGVN